MITQNDNFISLVLGKDFLIRNCKALAYKGNN